MPLNIEDIFKAIERRDQLWLTAIFRRINAGHFNENQFAWNARNELGRTPILCACHANELFLVELLATQEGVDVNAPDYMLNTPLHVCASSNRSEMVHILLQNGANCHLKNCDHRKPIDLCSDYTSRARRLLERAELGLRIPVWSRQLDVVPTISSTSIVLGCRAPRNKRSASKKKMKKGKSKRK